MILFLKNLAILDGLLQIAIEAPRSRTLYATIKNKAATTLAKHFHQDGPLRLDNINR
jgi:hypothetical protein